MKVTIMTVAMAFPLAMLAACGGSGSGNSGSSDSTPPVVSASVAATASAGAPPASFAVCSVCHSTEAGKNGVGPTLHGIVGSQAGDVPGYPFSPALKGSGIVWNRDTLDIWLQGPMKMVPGTRMFQPVPDAARRREIIDYLETLK